MHLSIVQLKFHLDLLLGSCGLNYFPLGGRGGCSGLLEVGKGNKLTELMFWYILA